MSHQEKQEIFDQYAKSQEFDDWNDLLIAFELKLMSSDEFECYMYAACDLVQEEQQKRIAKSIKNIDTVVGVFGEHKQGLESMDEPEYIEGRKLEIKGCKEFLKSIESITNPEKKIN